MLCVRSDSAVIRSEVVRRAVPDTELLDAANTISRSRPRRRQHHDDGRLPIAGKTRNQEQYIQPKSSSRSLVASGCAPLLPSGRNNTDAT